MTAPYEESVKIRMRFELKILKTDVLNKLHANSLAYRRDDASSRSLPKQYPIFERYEHSS